MHRAKTKWIHILRSIESFSTILHWFESARSQLSNQCEIVANGSIDRKIWIHVVLDLYFGLESIYCGLLSNY